MEKRGIGSTRHASGWILPRHFIYTCSQIRIVSRDGQKNCVKLSIQGPSGSYIGPESRVSHNFFDHLSTLICGTYSTSFRVVYSATPRSYTSQNEVKLRMNAAIVRIGLWAGQHEKFCHAG